jgi:transposase
MGQDEFFSWKEPEKIQKVEREGIVKVLVEGKTYMNWVKGDEVAERIAIAQLYELGLGTQEELAEIFQMHVNSIAKYISTFRADGAGGLVSQSRGPKESWKLTPEVRAKILFLVLKEGIKEYRLIQKRLAEWNTNVSIASIRDVLVENGLVKESIRDELAEIKQGDLFEDRPSGQLELEFSNCGDEIPLVRDIEEDESLPIVHSGIDKRIRSNYSRSQRIYLDQLEQGEYNTYAGGLLFVPLLRQYNFLSTIKNVINIETQEGYSLDEICLTLFYFDLFRFESMENFKTVIPDEFGVLIGRLSNPSIYTLRRFLHKVKELNKSEELIEEFAREYLKRGIARWGVLYIDGHFLPYYGIYCISMGWHGVRKIPMKGSYNFIATDEKFNPLLFLIRSSSEDLLQKIPEIILKTKKLAKEVGLNEEDINRLIVIFDREGYSAELFRALDGRDKENGKFKARFITWGKYADKWVDDIEDEKFDKTVTVTYEIQEPEEVKYFDTERNMNKYGKIRAIVIESKRGRTTIYTNDKEIGAEIVVQLICRRWGEENLIKELIMKHMIEYSPGYEAEEIEEQPLVANPKVEELKQKRAELKSELSQIKSKFGHEVLEEMAKGRNWREIKKRHLMAIADIESINAKITLLDLEIDKHPEEIRFDSAHGEKLVELNYEKKRFLDCIKVFTYNMEKQMCKILLNYYGVKKEIYPALSMIIRRAGFIKLEGGKLRVQLRRFRNPQIDYAARRLCEDLNQMKPSASGGFNLPLHYEVI